MGNRVIIHVEGECPECGKKIEFDIILEAEQPWLKIVEDAD